MITRTIGNWTVKAEITDFGSLVWGEDGQYWQQCLLWGFEACDKMGNIWSREPVQTEVEAQAIVASLSDTDDWQKNEEWYFSRRVYGSPAWGVQDEIGLMDTEERQHYGF